MKISNTLDTSYHTINTHLQKFREAMLSRGLIYNGELIGDRKIHRFGQPEDKDKPCWYVLYLDNIPAASFGCFKRDIDETWCSRDINTLSTDEREEYSRKVAECKKTAELEKIKLQQKAAIQSQQKLINAQEPNPEHPYLVKKQILPIGIRQSGNSLMIPLRDENGYVVNVQYIYVDENGEYQKRFTTYARKFGCFHVIGKLTQRIRIAEGWATSMSIYLATNECVIVAFDAGNLKPVAENIKLLFPNSEIIIAGDNDHTKNENTGLKKATEAAISIGCKFITPEFETGSIGTDFNDLMIEKGIDEVRRQLLRVNDKKPIPLPDSRPEVLPLTKEMLPDAIRDYVFDVAERQQSLPDYVAVAAIIGLSGLLGRKAVICPKQLDDWSVTPNQWGAIIGRPSAMKSPSMKEALKPLRAFETKAAQQFEEDTRDFEIESLLNELEKNKVKKEANIALKKNGRAEAKKALKNFDNSEPVRKRLIVNDATVEKLGELLNENSNGLILVRDELSGWLSRQSREEHQSERAFYLECFDGNGCYTYDRIERGTIEIKNCTLSVVGGIQPSKLTPIVLGATSGATDDGLIQRLQFAVWPDDIGKWEWIDRAPNQEALKQYNDTFDSLHILEFKTEDGEPKHFRFTAEAQEMFIHWMTEIQVVARNAEIHPALESHILKMPQTIASLALLFEIIGGGRESVGIKSIAQALEWADYLLSHAKRLYSLATNRSLDGAKLILNRKSKLPNPFTARDIYRNEWTGLNTIEAVNEALNWLIDYNYISLTKLSATDTNGRPKTEFRWIESN